MVAFKQSYQSVRDGFMTISDTKEILQKYLEKFQSLRSASGPERPRPHKPVMLLPNDNRLWPKPEALDCRMEMLREAC